MENKTIKNHYVETKESKLRLNAEVSLRKRKLHNPDDPADLTKNEVIELIHNLKVHQIELEMQNEELKNIQMDLDESHERYFDLYDLAPVGYMILSEHGSVIESNLTAAKSLGMEPRKLLNQKIMHFIHEDDRDIYYFFSQKLFQTHIQQECELRMMRKDGSIYWGKLSATLMFFKGNPIGRLIISDISERKLIEQTLIDSEEKFRLICTSMEQGLVLFEMCPKVDESLVDFTFLDCNDSYTKLFGISKEMSIGKSLRSVIPTQEEKWMALFERVAYTQEPEFFESFYAVTDKYYSTYAYSPKKNQLVLLISDNTERIQKQNEINYMNYHDQLTGLYNRRFLGEELKRLDTERNLTLTLAMGDINGLKLVNDSFGHATGDALLIKVSEIIKKCCRSDDIIARISGDEFVIILPNADTEETEKVIDRIKKLSETETVDSIQISIAFGFETKRSMAEDIAVVLKSAEDFMYRHKLYESAFVKSDMIDLIMMTLFEKNNRESLHSKRVGDISEKIALAMEYSDEQVSQIRLAGLMHDVGKIGITENLLDGKFKLNKDEWKEMKRHSEIGYRILSSANEFSEIASFILEHHERWDGQGYPKGIKGDMITIPARVIAIADAYDAMTRERTYKKVLSKEDAIIELNRCKNTQFDPEIVEIFINQVVEAL